MSKEKPSAETQVSEKKLKKSEDQPKEVNGYKDLGLPEPTRFGDWEVKGRCSDF